MEGAIEEGAGAGGMGRISGLNMAKCVLGVPPPTKCAVVPVGGPELAAVAVRVTALVSIAIMCVVDFCTTETWSESGISA